MFCFVGEAPCSSSNLITPPCSPLAAWWRGYKGRQKENCKTSQVILSEVGVGFEVMAPAHSEQWVSSWTPPPRRLFKSQKYIYYDENWKLTVSPSTSTDSSILFTHSVLFALLIRSATISVKPPAQASCRGMAPSSSLASNEAPLSSSSCIKKDSSSHLNIM